MTRLGLVLANVAALLVGLGCPMAEANVACSGTVGLLALSPQTGTLTAAIGPNGVWSLCNVTTAQSGVSVDACKTMYAQLSFALATGRRLQVDFNDGASTWTSETSYCTSVGSWGDPL